MSFSRDVALAIKNVIPCKRIGMSLIGLEVPHVHVHLIPISNMEDMQFVKKISRNFTKFFPKTINRKLFRKFHIFQLKQEFVQSYRQFSAVHLLQCLKD